MMKIKENNQKIAWGQYFTSKEVADFMVGLISKRKNPSALEPCAGNGAFIKALLEKGFSNIKAYEIDHQLINKINGISIQLQDFLKTNSKEKFDLIIGNPPYVHWNNIVLETRFFLERNPFWSSLINGEADLLYPFIIWSVEKLKVGGELIFIVPYFWFTSTHASGLRHYLTTNGIFNNVIHFGELKLFKDAYPNNIIFKYTKLQENSPRFRENIKIVEYKKRIGDPKEILRNINQCLKLLDAKKSIIKNECECFWGEQFLNSFMWSLISPQTQKIINKAERSCMQNIPILEIKKIWKMPIINLFDKKDLKLLNLEKDFLSLVKYNNLFYYVLKRNPENIIKGNYLRLKHVLLIGVGTVTGLDEAFQLLEEEYKKLSKFESKYTLPIVKAKNLRRYSVKKPSYFIWIDNIKNEKIFKKQCPNIYKKLLPFKERLEKRYEKTMWFHYATPRNMNLFERYLTKEKIFVPVLDRAKISRFAITNKPYFGGSDCAVLVKREDITIKDDLKYILGQLNSTWFNTWYRTKGPHRGDRIQYSQSALEEAPIRLINWRDSREINIHNQVVKLVEETIKNSEKEEKNRKLIDGLFKKLLF